MNLLFYFYSKIYCPHPSEYIDWVNDEWESWWICTICNRDNLWEKLKVKLYPYKGLIDYKVWELKRKLGILKRDDNLPF